MSAYLILRLFSVLSYHIHKAAKIGRLAALSLLYEQRFVHTLCVRAPGYILTYFGHDWF